ncbi:MAG: HIT family protein [Nitrospiraceae bacterium]
MKRCQSWAQALTEVFRAIKINYELLGNQLPHIHWHLIPRLADDPAHKDPVWTVSHEARRLTDGELRERIHRLEASVKSRLR